MPRNFCVLFLFFIPVAICKLDGNQRKHGIPLSSALDDSYTSSRGVSEGAVNGNNSAIQSNGKQIMEHKSFKSLTKTANGKTTTTIWYYNSKGPNYRFTIIGQLPVPRDKMIQWLEKNAHRYKVTPVPFLGDAEERPQRPPDSKPKPVPAPPPKKKITVTTAKPVVVTSPSPERYLPSGCGLTGAQLADKIVGGDIADIENTPWQVALVRRGGKSLACGGSIISTRHVISATHCFRSKDESDLEPTFVKKEDRIVVAGASILRNGDADEHTIDQLFLHSMYTEETRRNDIALIVVNGEFSFGATIFPVCLPSRNELFFPGRECTISGWGLTAANASRTETRLRSAEVKITTDSDCKAQNERALPITKGMVCAGNYETGGVDTCQGDSGGALACKESGRYKLFGVTSWGIGCGDAKYPGVYTRVPKYINWIMSRIEMSMRDQN